MMVREKGFTIVELLIVIVVIGILAAITLVAFSGIQNRANEAGIQSDFSNAQKKLMLYRTETGTWPAQTDSGLGAVGITASRNLYDTAVGNFLYCGSTTSTHYALVARGTNGTTYAQGSNRAFGPYTTHLIGNYSAICTDLVGSSVARYGYTTTENWRPWVQ